MGILGSLLKKFSCKSSCKFNEQPCNMDLHRLSLDQFDLKYKDIEKLHRILSKRQRKNVTDI